MPAPWPQRRLWRQHAAQKARAVVVTRAQFAHAVQFLDCAPRGPNTKRDVDAVFVELGAGDLRAAATSEVLAGKQYVASSTYGAQLQGQHVTNPSGSSQVVKHS